MGEEGGRDTSRCACDAGMMVVLEKKGLGGMARPYTLGWREAGMRAADGEANRSPSSAPSEGLAT